MLTIANLIVHLLEGVAIAAAVYLVARKSIKTLQIKEFVFLVLTITATFIVLDLFAPQVGAGARQGSGFGLGFSQVAGDGSYPAQYFVENMEDEEGFEDGVEDFEGEVEEFEDGVEEFEDGVEEFEEGVEEFEDGVEDFEDEVEAFEDEVEAFEDQDGGVVVKKPVKKTPKKVKKVKKVKKPKCARLGRLYERCLRKALRGGGEETDE